jgi:hypothetical protein
MALAKPVEVMDSFGDLKTFQNAYFRVENVSGNKTRMFADIKVYKDLNSIAKPIKQLSEKFTPDLTGKNLIAQAYNHLKTLPEFAGAIDC